MSENVTGVSPAITERTETATTVRLQVKNAIQTIGLDLSGFQYPLVGEESYQVEVDCESAKQLGEVYTLVKDYADKTKMRIKSATVQVIPDWHRAVIILLSSGSKA